MAESISWAQMKDVLMALSQAEMLKVVKDLCDRSKANREFLVARLGITPADLSLESYRNKIIAQFTPIRGYPRLNLSVARQALRDYRQATHDLPGVLDLMLTYVEYGAEVTRKYGDQRESFYNSLVSVFSEATKLLRSPEGREMYDGVRERLLKVEKRSHDFGWGYGDMITQELDELREFCGDVDDR